MKFLSAFAIGLLLVGCGQRKPVMSKEDEALARALDADIEEIRAGNPGIKEVCLKKLRTGQMGAFEWINNPECFEMLPARSWTGLWNTGWEWTNFCPEPAKKCPISSEHGDIWIEFAEGAYRGLPEQPDGVYRINFIGRRTNTSGYFGHLGQYDHLMVVDRVISIRKIPGEKYTKRF